MDTLDGKHDVAIFREGKPRAARLSLCGAPHDFLTFSALCSAHRDVKPRHLFCVIGTDYGVLHTPAGDWRVWGSASGARRAAKRYASHKES